MVEIRGDWRAVLASPRLLATRLRRLHGSQSTCHSPKRGTPSLPSSMDPKAGSGGMTQHRSTDITLRDAVRYGELMLVSESGHSAVEHSSLRPLHRR